MLVTFSPTFLAQRARLEWLDWAIDTMPRAGTIDELQHWIYERPELAADPDAFDEEYLDIFRRYEPAVSMEGLEHEIASQWRDIYHIFAVPFYFLDYAMATYGAIQVWLQSRQDSARAIARYRQALALGGSCSLPELLRCRWRPI